jgi:CRISPR-associated endonuclease Csn1
MNKTILGLDLGTNSIGWALINQNFDNTEGNPNNLWDGKIIDMGCRIIPMSQDMMSEFDKGNSISQTAERTGYRSIRRLRERFLLRRERLHRTLNILGFLPKHYAASIDFEKRLGQFLPETEPKIAYRYGDDSKFHFLFQESFEEMVNEFKIAHNNGIKVPFDWTIYYLRKKALTEKIEKEELAWLLLHFNQKRGYYQLRGEDEDETPNKLVEFHTLLVVDVIADERQKGKDSIWYSIILENGWVYRRESKIPLFDWKGKAREFIVTTELNEDGSIKKDKEGKEKRSFRAPKEEDWTLLKKKTEQDIKNSEQSTGTYIYDALLKNPNQKIKGKLVRTIERKFYKDELLQILKTQQLYHNELQDQKLYEASIEELYENNHTHRKSIGTKDFTHLFLNDIIFYQRPLKSKKSLVSNCRYEKRSFIHDGEIKSEPVKCIAASNPLFQEIRLWQWIKNLKFHKRETDEEITETLLKSSDDWESLFNWLNQRKEVDHKAILKYLLAPLGLKPKQLDAEVAKYRWNYVYDGFKNESKLYPCNETRSQMVTALAKVENVPIDFLTKERELALWHILYSVTDKLEIETALKKFARKNGLGEDFAEIFKKLKPYESDFGSYSAKAIKKLLPLMRIGEAWEDAENQKSISDNMENYRENIKAVITKIKSRPDKTANGKLLAELEKLEDVITNYQGLPIHLACYVAYGRHSEDGEITKWQTVPELDAFIKNFRQHSLRNPIVEQVITETLRVVKDIWLHHGKGKEHFFDEIHIELGREMKNPAEKRKQMTEQIGKNENTNLRIKALLAELKNDYNIENVIPYSPYQQEILKLYEEGLLSADDDIPEDILKISQLPQPSTAELHKYKLWLQQGYTSPYTGAIIPLNKLFTPAYEIEHIIPQSRFYDDSFSNKVICEAAINKLKDNQTGMEFILSKYGSIIEGVPNPIFTKEQYEDHVKRYFSKSPGKLKKLLMEDIPEKMVERQMNDTRYISKIVKNYLSNIVRKESGDDGTTSVNVLSSNGAITSVLKNNWGFNEIWNELIADRFIRLNGMTNSNDFGDINPNTNKFLPTVPLGISKGFSKKRIDHRHHALDALVIACATRSHINLLNNQNAIERGKNKEQKQKSREDLRRLLCTKKYNKGSNTQYKWVFIQPWPTIAQETKEQLETTVVSFKQNLRVINKTVNHSQKYLGGKKEMVKQEKGDNWAIRKPMHKDTVSGLVKLRFKKTVQLSSALDNWKMITDKSLRKKIKELVALKYDKKMLQKFFKDRKNQFNDKDISKVEIFFLENEQVASRVKLDDSFNEEKIKSITDSGIQKILFSHLGNYQNIKDEKGKLISPETIAFSAEGIEALNLNITALNDGKHHNPIFKVRTFEPMGNKFAVGQTGNKKTKFVEAAKGTNLFFAIYKNAETKKRSFETIGLNIVIERQKQGLYPVPEMNEKGEQLAFYLSPNDLVYVPTLEEIGNHQLVDFNNLNKRQIKGIYKCVSFSSYQCFFISNNIATSIFNKVEFSALNKTEKSMEDVMIKEFCWKLEIDRLGKIKRAIK